MERHVIYLEEPGESIFPNIGDLQIVFKECQEGQAYTAHS